MPIFEYRCNKCNHISSFLEKSGSKKKHICEKCNSDDLEKVFSTFSPQAGKSSSVQCPGCPMGTCPTAHECGPGGCMH